MHARKGSQRKKRVKLNVIEFQLDEKMNEQKTMLPVMYCFITDVQAARAIQNIYCECNVVICHRSKQLG